MHEKKTSIPKQDTSLCREFGNVMAVPSLFWVTTCCTFDHVPVHWLLCPERAIKLP